MSWPPSPAPSAMPAWRATPGLTVSVRAGAYDVSYLHLSAVAVEEGQAVAAGTRLGAAGTSGRRSVAGATSAFRCPARR